MVVPMMETLRNLRNTRLANSVLQARYIPYEVKTKEFKCGNIIHNYRN